MSAPPPDAAPMAAATFDSFVVGKANEVAWTAARTFASAAVPGFNPLFVPGGTGVGKTHLLHAIAAEHERHWPQAHRLSCSAEQLVAAYGAAVRGGAGFEYELELRSADLLLVDHLDVLGRWPATQDLLRRCVGAVLERGGRVVFAAERAPHDLDGFCPRLLALAEGGLGVDVNAPDLELRLAIVQSLAAADSLELPDEVVAMLARNLLDVRRLRGALTRLAVYSRCDRRRIDGEYARELLGDLLRAQRRYLSIDEIQTRVSDHFRILKAEMTSARRAREVARPRQVAMYLSKQLTPRSLPEIGRRFGGRDHTTVIHAVRQIEKLRLVDSDLDRDLRSLERELQ